MANISDHIRIVFKVSSRQNRKAKILIQSDIKWKYLHGFGIVTTFSKMLYNEYVDGIHVLGYE